MKRAGDQLNRFYRVTVTAKFPACGEQPGEFIICGTSPAHAIRQARNKMSDAGHTRQDGPLVYRAVLTEGAN